jgi:hypothetical protein
VARIIHPLDRARMLAAVEAHFRGETTAYESEFRVRHKNGHWVWLLSRGKVVERDEFGIAVRMAGTHMDLTRRKAIEAKMERSAELLKQTGELAQIGGWELDLATLAARLDRAGLAHPRARARRSDAQPRQRDRLLRP